MCKNEGFFDFKGIISLSPCSASNKHLRAHSLTPKLSHRTQLQRRAQRVRLGTPQPSHCQTSLRSFSVSPEVANLHHSQCFSHVFCLKPPAPNNTGKQLWVRVKETSCLLKTWLEKTSCFLSLSVLLSDNDNDILWPYREMTVHAWMGGCPPISSSSLVHLLFIFLTLWQSATPGTIMKHQLKWAGVA